MFDIKEFDKITRKLKEQIRKNVEPNIFALWFENLKVLNINEKNISVSVDTDVQKMQLELKYKNLIADIIKDLYDFNVTVEVQSMQNVKFKAKALEQIQLGLDEENEDEEETGIEIEEDEEEVKDIKEEFNEDENKKIKVELEAIEESEVIIKDIKDIENFKKIEALEAIETNNKTNRVFKSEYTFDNFVVGSSNRFAYKACTVVAQFPAKKYNPFFIHGPSGLGKTHLLYAIANEYSQQFRNAKIIYTSAEEFTNLLINSLSEGNRHQQNQYLQVFRDKYRSCDMLLIDDIQFIAGKNSTQEEFFHTFNALYSAGKQIILTSDRPPRDIKMLEDRLTSRFESGLIADVQPPDLELRIAILKRKANDMQIKISNEVLFFLAENISSNIRQIEGAIKKLNAYSFLNDTGITLDLAKSSISDILAGTEPANVIVEKVISLTAQSFEVPLEEIKGRKRTKEISFARNVAIYIIRKITDLALPKIGRIFDRDHSTIYSAVNAIDEEIKNDSALEEKINEIARIAKIS